MGNTHRYMLDTRLKERSKIPELLDVQPTAIYNNDNGLVVIAYLTNAQVLKLIRQHWVRSIGYDGMDTMN